MNMLEKVMADPEIGKWVDGQMTEYDRILIERTMKATLMQVAPIVASTWEDSYPADLEPWQVKGRKLFRKKRLVERLLLALPALPLSWLTLFTKTFGELEATEQKPAA